MTNPEASETDEEIEAVEAVALPDTQKRVLTQSLDERIGSLVDRMRRGRLKVQPDFQREFVWSRSRATKLIESILMRIPIPVIYVAELADGSWEVVDGQQRLTTVSSFIEGRFPDGLPFRLGGLSVRRELRSKTFKELPEEDQNAIEDYILRIIMIQKEASDDLKFEVFERLNTGAAALNDMELRNCIYRGPYNDLLKSLVENENLKRIRGDANPDNRMRDRGYVLRFFAMWRNTHLRYKAPMKQFMNHEMRDYRNAPADELARMRKVFEDAIDCGWSVFGPKAFRRYTLGGERNVPDGTWDEGKTLNLALWDTVLYVFSLFERRQIIPIADAIREEFLDLLASDARFNDYIGRTTDQPERVRYRADVWKARVEALVNTPAGETRAFSHALKERLYAADSSCAICGQRIQSVDDAEVDHVVHYWRGGRTLPENARLAHRFCNRQRGGRPD